MGINLSPRRRRQLGRTRRPARARSKRAGVSQGDMGLPARRDGAGVRWQRRCSSSTLRRAVKCWRASSSTWRPRHRGMLIECEDAADVGPITDAMIEWIDRLTSW